MRASLEQTRGLVVSSSVLADLLENGMERERAYRVIQQAAGATVASGADFGTELRRAGIETGLLEPERSLVHHDVILAIGSPS